MYAHIPIRYTYVCMYTYMFIYTYTYTHIHTYTHIACMITLYRSLWAPYGRG